MAKVLFDAAKYYHLNGEWFLHPMLLIPDHLHAPVSITADRAIRRVIGHWKRYPAKQAMERWQKNFFDHRFCSDESREEKRAYIHAIRSEQD